MMTTKPGKYIVINANSGHVELIDDPIALIHRDGYTPESYKIYMLGSEVKIKISVEAVSTTRNSGLDR